MSGEMIKNAQIYIERAVLISLYESEKYNLPYKDIDEDVFVFPPHKWLIRQIKKAKKNGIPLDLLRVKIEEKMAGSEWENAYLELIATNPLSNWQLYYSELKARKIEREAKKLFGANV